LKVPKLRGGPIKPKPIIIQNSPRSKIHKAPKRRLSGDLGKTPRHETPVVTQTQRCLTRTLK